jgi:prevent-host-death family protein
MGEQTVVSASEFAKNFGRYLDEVQSGKIIEVTSHGRVVGAFVSSRELEYFERLKRQERQVHLTGQLPDELVAAIAGADYGVGPQ